MKEIVAGSKANICNECVETCSRIIEMARLKKLVWDALVELNQKQAAQVKT